MFFITTTFKATAVCDFFLTATCFLEARGIFRSLRDLVVLIASFEHFITLLGFHFGYYFFPAWLRIARRAVEDIASSKIQSPLNHVAVSI